MKLIDHFVSNTSTMCCFVASAANRVLDCVNGAHLAISVLGSVIVMLDRCRSNRVAVRLSIMHWRETLNQLPFVKTVCVSKASNMRA